MPTTSRFIKISILLLAFMLLGVGCKPTAGEIEQIENVTLSYWQVWHNSFDIQPIIDEYQKQYPNVKIQFRNLRFEEYEETMLKALAEDEGPDIFSIPHDWVGLYKNIIEPAPASVEIQRVIVREPGVGELDPTVERIYRETVSIITPIEIKRDYYSFVKEDVIEESRSETGKRAETILAVPLTVDTLALYYNRDTLEENGIFTPPETWERFQQDVIAIAKVDDNNGVLQAAAALGTVDNIVRPTDILSALMIQTGVQMIDEEHGYATFHQSVREKDQYNAGLEALRFYTDFSDVTKKVYTWNDSFDSALELFKQGKLAYFFGYTYNLPEIQNARINFDVAYLPRPSEAISTMSVANYWVETVSKKSAHINYAWHFLNFLSQKENLLALQNTTGKISPRLEHGAAITDPVLAIFAKQAPTAEVWYHGNDAPAAEEAIEDMIRQVVDGDQTLDRALNFGAQQVSQTLR